MSGVGICEHCNRAFDYRLIHNGFNDSMQSLAQMQVTAHRILRSLGHGQQLVAPSIAFTDGAPTHGLKWLDRFLSQPGRGRGIEILP